MYDPRLIALVNKFAPQYGVDPQAALAVALTEGGIKFGAIGDAGTSFGPWQLHEGGALPAGKDAKWANSPAGVKYALRKMGEVSGGLTGQQAIEAIVRKFERPADPDSQVAKAIGNLGSVGGLVGAGGASTRKKSKTALTIPGQAQFRESLVNALMSGEMDGETLIGLAMERRALATAASQDKAIPTPTDTSLSLSGLVMPLSTPLGSSSEFMVKDAEGAPGEGGKFHAGKDWFAPAGSPVRSPIDGTVVEVSPSRGTSGQVYGGVVKIQASNGMVFTFRHVNPGKFKVGSSVRAGMPIAKVSPWDGGSPHSHLEVWKTLEGGYNLSNMVDPMTLFGS